MKSAFQLVFNDIESRVYARVYSSVIVSINKDQLWMKLIGMMEDEIISKMRITVRNHISVDQYWRTS